MIFAQDSPSSMANMYGSALTTGSTVKDVREWPDRIKAVTADAGPGGRREISQSEHVGDRLSAGRRRKHPIDR